MSNKNFKEEMQMKVTMTKIEATVILDDYVYICNKQFFVKSDFRPEIVTVEHEKERNNQSFLGSHFKILSEQVMTLFKNN